MDAISEKYNEISFLVCSTPGTPPLDIKNTKYDNNIYNKIITYLSTSSTKKLISTVVLIARWENYASSYNFFKKSDTLINTLEKNGYKVVLIKQPPSFDLKHPFDFSYDKMKLIIGPTTMHISHINQKFKNQNLAFETLGEKYPNLLVVDPTKYFLNQSNHAVIEKNKIKLYTDNNHLSYEGVLLLQDEFISILSNSDNIDK